MHFPMPSFTCSLLSSAGARHSVEPCLHQAADSCSGTWVESSLRALVFLSGGLRTHTIKPESLQAPTLPWPEPLPGLDPVRLATSGLTPPPMTAHTMPVCLTHWLQGWPDVYQAGDTEPCYVCLRLPRPNADVDEPIVAPDAYIDHVTTGRRPKSTPAFCGWFLPSLT